MTTKTKAQRLRQEEHDTTELYLERATVLRGYVEELCQQSACSNESAKLAMDGMNALVADLNEVAADADAALVERK